MVGKVSPLPLDFSVAPYTTGDLIDGMVSYRLRFIDQPWMLLAVMAALTTLCDPDNWNTVGEFTPTEAASLAIKMVEDFEPMDTIGWIVPFGGTTLPDYALWCNGASYLRTDYPELFATIGTIWGAADSTHFNVPKMNGRTPVGAGSASGLTTRTIAQQFGEEDHQLSTAELANHGHVDSGHTHTDVPALPSIADTITGVPIPSAIPGVGVTGLSFANITSTGSDVPHNNIQPSIVTNFIIFTR